MDKLLEVLQRLVDAGNTVLVIEHNLDVIKCADWLIDLGPEGGDAGGELMAEGTPEEICAHPESETGKVLRRVLPACGPPRSPERRRRRPPRSGRSLRGRPAAIRRGAGHGSADRDRGAEAPPTRTKKEGRMTQPGSDSAPQTPRAACAPGAGNQPSGDRPGDTKPTGRRAARERDDGRPPEREKAYLIAVDTGDDEGWTAEESLNELAALVETAGAEVVGRVVQNREGVHPVWYLGTGKAEELKEAKSSVQFTTMVADDELSPKQMRTLETFLDVKVLDRSSVILDIFAQRAQTHEGRIQVELAQLEYQLPRLTRLWTHLSRTGGGIGTRGPGETQLETDRRVIRQRIKKTKERVDEVRRRRETAARSRERRLLPTVAIVGYTNAGKSTLLNALVGEEAAAAEDMLFATLDPTTRRVRLTEGQTIIVSDTVGFIHKLPHQLVDAFQATLEEVTRADALIEVVDLADRHASEHRRTVQTVLDELGAGHKPRVVVLNKADRTEPHELPAPGVVRRDDLHVLRASALTGEGIDRLRSAIAEVLAELWARWTCPSRTPRANCWRGCASGARSRSTTATRMCRIVGKIPPTIAAELQTAARAWARARRANESEPQDDGETAMADELLTAGKIAEKLGVSPAKVSKAIKDNGVEPDQKKGNCRLFRRGEGGAAGRACSRSRRQIPQRPPEGRVGGGGLACGVQIQ